MVRKKDPPKALFSVKADFLAALENVAHEGIMLLTVLETTLKNDSGIKSNVKALLEERVAAFRAALVEPLVLDD